MTAIIRDRPYQGGSTSSVPGAAVSSFSLWPAGWDRQQGEHRETPPMVARLSQNCWLSNKREPSGGGVQLWQRGFLSMSGV